MPDQCHEDHFFCKIPSFCKCQVGMNSSFPGEQRAGLCELQDASQSCTQSSDGITGETRQRLIHRGNLWISVVHHRQNLIYIPAWRHPTVFREAGHHPINSTQSCELQLPMDLFEGPFWCLLSPIKGLDIGGLKC